MKILITGDFCPINRTELLIKKKDYQSIYNDFLPNLQNADLAITNLESPLTNSSNSTIKVGPKLKAKPESVEALIYGNFKLVTLANNHIMDFGENGLTETIEILKQKEISFVGAGMNNTEARKPFIFSKNGIEVGIISIAENEWSTTDADSAGAAPVDEINNYYDISELKKTVDYVIVIAHGGLEMNQLPSPRIKKLYRFFIDAGADIVVGHHTHCFSGLDKYKEKHIFYSLGNFIFDRGESIDKIWKEGFAVELKFSKEQIDFNIHPYIQNYLNPGIKLMDDLETNKFYKELKRLCSIIDDDQKLNVEFDKMVSKVSIKYNRYLQPYSNLLLLGLFNRGLLPDIWSKRKKTLFLNLLKCETHREILLKILK